MENEHPSNWTLMFNLMKILFVAYRIEAEWPIFHQLQCPSLNVVNFQFAGTKITRRTRVPKVACSRTKKFRTIGVHVTFLNIFWEVEHFVAYRLLAH